jgi:hypothetical protein
MNGSACGAVIALQWLEGFNLKKSLLNRKALNENKFSNNNLLRNNNSDKTLYVFLISFFIVYFYTPVLFAGSVSLSWDAPTENTDGTRLTDLAGYNIYYGTAAGDYSNSINVGKNTTYQVTNLRDGLTYYFAVTAYDISGNESEYSTEVQRSLSGLDTELFNYYCDNDNDSYAGTSIDGSCIGIGCEPAGCQTMPGSDCNDNDSNVNPGENDSNCNGIDENCDGTADNDYVPSLISCGTGVCSSVGPLECLEGTEVNSCRSGMPEEEHETTCGDDLDNDCDGQIDEGCTPDIEVSRVLISEDFSEGIPASWFQEDAWSTDNECGRMIGEPFEGTYAIVDSSCVVTSAEELVTGTFNTLSCNSVTLDFSNQYDWHSGNVEVNVSSDGAAAWENIMSVAADDGYPLPNRKELDISSLAGSPEAQIKFSYANDATDGFWALDNVWVTCQSDQVAFSARVQETVSETVMVTNRGQGDLVIDMISVGGEDAPEFSVGENEDCTTRTLLPGDSCAVDIIFAPLSTGAKSANIIISSNDPDAPDLSLLLAGTGEDMILPVPVIKVNGLSGTVNLMRNVKGTFTIELDTGSFSGVDADWWLLLHYRGRWYHYDESAGRWKVGYSVYKQGPLTEIAVTKSIDETNFPRGSFTMYFAVDTKMNGVLGPDEYYYDHLIINVE